MRVGRRPQLEQRLDDEAVRPEQLDPLSVPELEVDRARPAPRAGAAPSTRRRARDPDDRAPAGQAMSTIGVIAEKANSPPGRRMPGGLRHGQVGVAERHRAESQNTTSNDSAANGVASALDVHERKLDARLRHQPAGVLELALGEVQAGDPRPDAGTARSTTARRRSRARAHPCRARRRAPVAPPRGVAKRPRPARPTAPAGGRASPGTRRRLQVPQLAVVQRMRGLGGRGHHRECSRRLSRGAASAGQQLERDRRLLLEDPTQSPARAAIACALGLHQPPACSFELMHR